MGGGRQLAPSPARPPPSRREKRIEQRTGRRFDLDTGHILTFGDQLILRTLGVNVVFVGVLLVWFPKNVFTALSARGDWFLDGSTASFAPALRKNLFRAADRLEWLWVLTHEDPFADDAPEPTPAPTTSVEPPPTPNPAPESGDHGDQPPPTPKPKDYRAAQFEVNRR